MKQAFALYDFDDTFFRKDSMGHLLKYDLKKHPLHVFECIPLAFKFVLYKLKLIDFLKVKESLIFPLKYLNDDDLQDFYDTCIKPKLYENVVQTVYQHQKEGKLLWLVSASPEIYVKKTDLPFDVIIGTKTIKGTNKITSKNCKGEQKVVYINEILNQKGLEIDYDNSYCYSDSLSDLPMFNLVKNKYQIDIKDGSIHKLQGSNE